MKESIDWRDLLGRYMKHVYGAENILYSMSESACINKSEYTAFKKLYNEIQIITDAKQREWQRIEDEREIRVLEARINKLKER